MKPLGLLLCLSFATIGSLTVVPSARSETSWMSEEAVRADFIGKTLQSYYHNGVTWTAGFDEAGRYRVSERGLDARELQAEGRWHFRGRAFCLFYGSPSWPLRERCAAVTKISANCCAFHLVWPVGHPFLDDDGFRPQLLWHSRGWRQGEPSTCEERPIV